MFKGLKIGLALVMAFASTGAIAGSYTCQRQVIYRIPETGGVYEFVWCCTTTQYGTSCHGEYQYNWTLGEVSEP